MWCGDGALGGAGDVDALERVGMDAVGRGVDVGCSSDCIMCLGVTTGAITLDVRRRGDGALH